MSDTQSHDLGARAGQPGQESRVQGSVGARPAAKLMTERETPVEVYIDGIAGLSVRAGVAKIDCYSVAPHEQTREEPEIRRLSHRIVLPALALNELMQFLQRSQEVIRASREQVEQQK